MIWNYSNLYFRAYLKIHSKLRLEIMETVTEVIVLQDNSLFHV